jgi:hypothetical protein
MEIKWLTYANSNKRHAFPVDEEKCGDWSICGKGAEDSKSESDSPLCEKCPYLMKKHSNRVLGFKRMSQKRLMDFNKEHGL